MASPFPHDLGRSRWSRRTGRAIEFLCFVLLLIVMATVIYGFALRAIWAHGYWVAVGVAVTGALIVMIGLAQQSIAARDVATWRDMAEWQISAARQKLLRGQAAAAPDTNLDPESPLYYEHLVEVLIEGAQRAQDEDRG